MWGSNLIIMLRQPAHIKTLDKYEVFKVSREDSEFGV